MKEDVLKHYWHRVVTAAKEEFGYVPCLFVCVCVHVRTCLYICVPHYVQGTEAAEEEHTGNYGGTRVSILVLPKTTCK